MMKTLKEPRPFCCSFLLPLSPLSRRRHVAFCAFNQQLFLSSRDLMSVFCPDSLSLSLSLAKQPKREPERIFSDQKDKQKKPLFPPLHQKGGKISRSFFFIFVSSGTDSWHPKG